MLYTSSIKYPNTFNLISGKTDLDSKFISINRCIALILTSAKGELLGDPQFGCRLYELLFDQYSESLNKIIKSEIIEAVGRYESRVSFSEDDITVTPATEQSGHINSFTITINYTIINTTIQSTATVELKEDIRNVQQYS